MSPREIRKKAREILKTNFKPLALMTLITMALYLACFILSCIGLGTIAALIVMPALMLGMVMSVLKAVRGQEIKVTNLYDGFGCLGRSIWLYYTNSFLTSLWSLLLIVPGIIKGIEYSMSFYILADNPDWSASDARNESIRIMQGNKWRYFCLQMIFIVWILLSVLTLGILCIWLAPYMYAANAAFYEEVKPKKVVYVPIEELENQSVSNTNSI